MILRIIWLAITLSFLILGFKCIFDSEWGYRWNLKYAIKYANFFKNVPLLGFFAKWNLKSQEFMGVWFIRFWGIMAVLIGTSHLYAILTQ